MISRDLAEAMERRSVEFLGRVPKARQAEVSVIAFVVRWAPGDPRHQVVEIAADAGAEAGRRWQPSAFAFPSLGRFGDPVEDPEVAALWAQLNERYAPERWREAAGTRPALEKPNGEMTPLALLRERYLAALPECARLVRRRLGRRVGWADRWTMFMVTDAEWDLAHPGSQQVNDGPLPTGLEDYLGQRYEGAVAL